MKKELTNREIENALNILQGEKSFLRDENFRISFKNRHAIKVNMKILSERMGIFAEERADILRKYEKLGTVKIDEDGRVSLTGQDPAELNKELNEAYTATNTLELEKIDINEFMPLKLTYMEGEVLDLMAEEENDGVVETEPITEPVTGKIID